MNKEETRPLKPFKRKFSGKHQYGVCHYSPRVTADDPAYDIARKAGITAEIDFANISLCAEKQAKRSPYGDHNREKREFRFFDS